MDTRQGRFSPLLLWNMLWIMADATHTIRASLRAVGNPLWTQGSARLFTAEILKGLLTGGAAQFLALGNQEHVADEERQWYLEEFQKSKEKPQLHLLTIHCRQAARVFWNQDLEKLYAVRIYQDQPFVAGLRLHPEHLMVPLTYLTKKALPGGERMVIERDWVEILREAKLTYKVEPPSRRITG